MNTEKIRFVRLSNPNEAFRGVLFLLLGDPAYARAQLRVINTVWRSIVSGQYMLMVEDGEIQGAVLWCELQQAARDKFISEGQEPAFADCVTEGVSIFATALAAKRPNDVAGLWRTFVKLNAEREILYMRHNVRGERVSRIGIIRNGNLVTTHTLQDNGDAKKPADALLN